MPVPNVPSVFARRWARQTGWPQGVHPSLQIRVDTADQIFAACQNDPAWSTYSVDCGHDIMLDRPDELSAILEKAAE